ncbi:MAG: hypothetical protein GY806_17195 [Gammaproteobacteria bacterium]|nr:hypothetical protein [Gammaproteobacteria bacterium]
MRLILLLAGLILSVQLTAVAQQNSAKSTRPTILPSMELLEFLADFGELDDATFEIIEFHAHRDLMDTESDRTVSKQQKPEVADEK